MRVGNKTKELKVTIKNKEYNTIKRDMSTVLMNQQESCLFKSVWKDIFANVFTQTCYSSCHLIISQLIKTK